jgi:tetratricopeptide (TPR) repeat protein
LVTGEEATDRVLRTLRSQLQGHWGQIGRIEDRIGRSHGYLNRTLKRSWPLPFDVLMRTLDVLGVDPRSFFGGALDIAPSADAYLAVVEKEAAPSAALQALIEAIVRRSSQGKSRGDSSSQVPWRRGSLEDRLHEMARLPLAEQQLLLRTSHELRRSDFVIAYLDHLDSLRYQRPREARRLVETLATHLLPALAAGEARRVLDCRALGILGSCQRLLGESLAAAWTLRKSLALARRYRLWEVTAELLQRSAYVLSDHGQYRRALMLLREALEIHFDHQSAFGIAKTLVDRGILSGYIGADRDAIKLLARALRELPQRGSGKALERNREAIYHHLVLAHTALGELNVADRWLREATQTLGPGDRVRARLGWQRGKLLLARRAPDVAEVELRSALDIFDQHRDPDAQQVTFDLLRVLVASGRTREAGRLASDRAGLVFKDPQGATAALQELTGGGREGRLTLPRIDVASRAFAKRPLGVDPVKLST